MVTSIVALLAMAAWLSLVFYADSHPGRGVKSPLPAPPVGHEEITMPAAAAELGPSAEREPELAGSGR